MLPLSRQHPPPESYAHDSVTQNSEFAVGVLLDVSEGQLSRDMALLMYETDHKHGILSRSWQRPVSIGDRN